MSFRDFTLENGRVLLNAFTKDKEGKLDVSLGSDLKQLRGVARVRPVIERHRDVGPVDVHVGKGNFLCYIGGGQCDRRVLCVNDHWQDEKQRYGGKSKADHMVWLCTLGGFC